MIAKTKTEKVELKNMKALHNKIKQVNPDKYLKGRQDIIKELSTYPLPSWGGFSIRLLR